MIKDRRALGRGLSALINEYDSHNTNSNVTNINGNISYVSINEVIPNPTQPRQGINEEQLLELAKSIQEYGILQPILVNIKANDKEKYQIIAGERRWRAALSIGLSIIPVVITSVTELASLEIAIIENIQREDLNPIDQAAAYIRLIKEFGYTQEIISEKLAKSRSYISNTIRLLTLPMEVQNYIIDKKISIGHAKVLVGQEDALNIANRILTQDLNVRETEELVRKQEQSRKYFVHNENVNNESKNFYEPQEEVDFLNLARDLSNHLKLSVKIQSYSRQNGRILIDFTNFAELDRVLGILNSQVPTF